MRILFFPLPEYGHIIPTIALARRFIDGGHDVHYVTEARFFEMLERCGVHCESLPQIKIVERRRKREAIDSYIQRYNMGLEYAVHLLHRIRPDALLVDVFCSKYALAALQKNIKVVTVHTCADVETRFRSPITSNRRGLCETRCGEVFAWTEQFMARIVRGLIQDRRSFWLHCYLRKVFAKHGVGLYANTISPHVVNIDPIVLGPRSLSYSRLVAARYFGFCTPPFDCFPSVPPPVSFRRNEVPAVRVEKKIFVSFGTNLEKYTDGCRVLSNVVDALATIERTKVIVQTGRCDAAALDRLYRGNVSSFEWGNNRAIIGDCDGVVFHGGYGTFKECVDLKKPMAVVPFINDQFGSARRVREMGLGISLSRCDNVAQLRKMLVPWLRDIAIRRSWPARNPSEFEDAYLSLVHRIQQP